MLISLWSLAGVNASEIASRSRSNETGSVSTPRSSNAQTSPSSPTATELKQQVIASGGGSGTAGIYTSSGTVGQTATGSGSAGIYTLNQGYWQNSSAPCNCGDANGDGTINISDAVFLIQYIFAHGTAPNPLCQGDANGDGTVNISDAVFLIQYIFAHGAAPHCP